MTNIKILVKGYYRPKPVKVCSTITLVQDDNINIIIDPGSVKNPDIIHNSLMKNGLTAENIHCVCITHSHIDHYKNVSLFKNASVIDYWGEWKNDLFIENTSNRNITENVSILMTPGHSKDSISFIINTKDNVIAVCGDVFWFKNGPEYDSLAEDHTALKISRQLLINKADLIIPGHGAPFKTDSIKRNFTDK